MSNTISTLKLQTELSNKKRAKRSVTRQYKRALTNAFIGPLLQNGARRRRNPRKRKARTNPARNDAIAKYANTLNDPFEHGPIRLGWGCLVPSDLYTGLCRGNFTTNADGSFALALTPSLGSSTPAIYQNISGHAGTTWTNGQAFSGVTAIAASCGEARVVSAGIKVFPMVPATGTPGVLYAGCINATSVADLTAKSVDTLASCPSLNNGYGATGGCALVHPLGPDSFRFNTAPVIGYTGGSVFDSGAAVIAGQGFPASTLVYFEAVINLEGIQEFGNSAPLTNPEILVEPSLTDTFPSIESMWKTIKQYVPSAGQVYEGATRIPDIARKTSSIYNAYKRTRGEYFSNVGTNRMIIEELE